MRVNIAVCGFHYFNYVKFIAQAGVLGDFYFSHKFGAWRNGKLHYRGKALLGWAATRIRAGSLTDF